MEYSSADSELKEISLLQISVRPWLEFVAEEVIAQSEFMRANGLNYLSLIREKFHKVACQPPRNCLNKSHGSKGFLILWPEIWLVSLMPVVGALDDLS